MKTLFCLIWAASILVAAEYKFANTPEGKVRYQSWGTGDKALILVHGWTCDGSFWSANVPALRDKWRVITVDLPGHGGSDKPEVSYTMEFFAKGVEAVMRDAGVKKAVLAGHSMGAPVVRRVYTDIPERVAALVIVDGSVQPKGPRPAVNKQTVEPADQYRASMTKIIESMFSSHTTTEVRQEILSKMLSTPQHVSASARNGLFTMTVWDGEPANVPALAIYKRTAPEKTVRSQFPQVEFEAWDGYGHFLMMEDPERFNRRVKEFLEKIGF